MGLFGKLFGEKNGDPKPQERSLKEAALNTVDSLNMQIMQIEDDPDIPEEQKAEMIAKLKAEIKTFADSMGWKYDE